MPEIAPKKSSRYISKDIESLLNQATSHQVWSSWQLALFRIAFIFFALLVVPVKWEWYQRFFSGKTLFEFLSPLTGVRPDLITIQSESGRWGIASYATWGIALLIAVAGASIWTFLARKSRRTEYNTLYYWIVALARYRIAIGIIAFGFLKTFPMQMPYPSLANLNTGFGDYTAYKLYWQSVGVVTWYEIFLGYVEVVGGFLMFFRGTAALGAVINAGVLYNIAHANHAYDGGVHVYSAYFVLLSLFVLAYYAPNIWKLLIKEQDVIPQNYAPQPQKKWQRLVLLGFKYSLIFVFVVVLGYIRYDMHYNQGRLKEPVKPGLTGAKGYYHVTAFKVNGQEIPYSPLDTVRWQDAIFEKYSTFVFKVNKPVNIDLANGVPQTKDVDRTYEFAGEGGGRRFFYYDADTVKHILYLQDKNTGTRRNGEGRESRRTEQVKEKPRTKLVWHYSQPSESRFIISGLNEKKDSIYVVLDRIDRNYALEISRGVQ